MHAKSQVMQFFTRNMHACNASDFNKESLASHVRSLHTQQIGLEYRGFPFELTRGGSFIPISTIKTS